MIIFESVGDVSASSLINSSSMLGIQSGAISEGISPTYGMTADDMGVENIVIKFTWSD